MNFKGLFLSLSFSLPPSLTSHPSLSFLFPFFSLFPSFLLSFLNVSFFIHSIRHSFLPLFPSFFSLLPPIFFNPFPFLHEVSPVYLMTFLCFLFVPYLLFRRKREENKKHIEQSVKERQKVCFYCCVYFIDLFPNYRI